MSAKPDRTKEGLSRRSLLIGGLAAGGLVVGWSLWPRQYRPGLAATEDERVFDAWLKIARDGQVTVAVPQAELGQGVYTQLAQIVAGELGADWRTVAVQPAAINPLFANDLLARQWAPAVLPVGADRAGEEPIIADAIDKLATRSTFMVTAGSTSIRMFEEPARKAGAVARAMLCQAAAAQWDVAWESCQAQDGFVVFQQKRLRFGVLVDEAAALDPPDPVPLLPSPRNILSGTDQLRLDVPAKLDGSATFAGDVRLPEMLYASIRHGPIGDSRLKALRSAGAKDIIGLVDVVTNDRWVAAVATNWWAANKALDRLAPVFVTSGSLPSDESIETALAEALRTGKGWQIDSRGSLLKSLEKSAGTRVFEAQYNVAPALHAGIETRCATASVRGAKAEIWVATQAPAAAREAVASALGFSASDVILYPMMAGGAFGRALNPAVAVEAALISRQMGRPVQLTWSRAEECLQDHYRAPAKARMIGAIDGAGQLAGFAAKIAVPATMREQLRRMIRGDLPYQAWQEAADERDPLAVEGAMPPYAIPNIAIDHYPANVGIPTGRWRGNADSYTAFFVESFLDELARAAGIEPLSFRMQMLTGQPRLAACINGVAAMANWTGGAGGEGQGIACHVARGSYIAVIASARTGDRGVRVSRISAMVDAGRLINPDIARQQIEGGIVWGLAQALGVATGFEGGLANVRRLRDANLPTLADMPEVQVEFVRSDADPGGIGEIGVPAVAPAVSNALFSAAGVRMRNLPLLSDGL
ncbi:xanthine dehydrogenase family protein molybdopterin-binding subunit [Novosphingopyxis iocasae]|uniref:xanthine dehydrogenase family protein molybdopterin-binding subunit n=1 Tax=Novosphingopyxis iocasae TaxID=2762729 RepID=UPI001651A9EE|nr:molybdopterin cofactor-binding domain-containing protein [Novosphingopyxis iocasae]